MKKLIIFAGLTMGLISGAFAQDLYSENNQNAAADVLVVSFDLPAGGATIDTVTNSVDTKKHYHLVTGDTLSMDQTTTKMGVAMHFLYLNKINVLQFRDVTNGKFIGKYEFYLSQDHGQFKATPDTYTVHEK